MTEKTSDRIGPTRKWKKRQNQRARNRPQIRIYHCGLIAQGDGGYMIVVEGYGLRPGITPPLMTLGGVPIENLKFEPSGRRVTGVIRAHPGEDVLVVDLGFACLESRCASEE